MSSIARAAALSLLLVSGTFVAGASAQSFTDKLKGLFGGGKSNDQPPPVDPSQATITKLARDCTRQGGDITARIGIQGRVIVGPAGAPPTVEVPVRVAVVQGGVGEKVIATKAYKTTVNVGEDESVPFTIVADDLVYPMPAPSVADNYIFYVGFDPQLVSGADKAKPAKKKK
jgi:hypothetical protein